MAKSHSVHAHTLSTTYEWLNACTIRCGTQMTWRIDRVVGGDDIVALCISGRITKKDVDALRRVIEEEASAIAIDLRNVVLADRDAVKFLAQKELNGTVLRNCPPYIREWVARERAETMETSGDTEDLG